jgi:hypothetical protein
MAQYTDSTLSNQYSLSIRISSDGFSLSVVDESNNLLSTKSVPTALASLSVEQITQLISRETQLNYRSIHLIYESDVYQFVPIPVFRSNEAADYLSLQHKINKNDIVLYNYHPAWDTVNIFAIPKAIQATLSQLFPNTIIEHHVSYFLSAKVKTQHENSVFIWNRDKIMDLIVLKKGKLYLLNSFPYQTAEDFAYNTLNVIEQLSIDTENCAVRLFNAEKKTELKHTLEKYLTVKCN